MTSYVIVGMQYGDEGKGKIIDVLANRAKYVVRFQGGNNAGHTVVIENQQFILHLLPSGVLHAGVTCLIGNGVVVDLKVLLQEIAVLQTKGINTDKIFISDRVHLIMPYHIKLDELQELELKHNKIGTTKRGIGPCYADKYLRIGIRACDLLDLNTFKEKLKLNLEVKNALFTKIYQQEAMDLNTLYHEYVEYISKIKYRIKDCSAIVNTALDNQEVVMFEGAQAAMLDIDFGSYPYVTSSNPTAGAICSGVGVAPHRIQNVIGVSKAYTTRVGEGPFITELAKDKKEQIIGEQIARVGNEYGSTTKRKRRCGWLDLNILKHATLLNGVSHIVITKLDVLANIEKIKICVGYKVYNKIYHNIPASLEVLKALEPIYETFEGFSEDISNITKLAQLPKSCLHYVNSIEELLGIPIAMISVGPSREQNIWLKKL